jgi:predicted DNA-binding protein
MSTTIRVSEGTRQRAADLAARTGSQMQVVVEKAFEDGYRRLADDAEAWDQIEAERRGEAPSLRDGVE